MSISWPAMLKGFVMGVVITTLFALGPLLGVRKISPLKTLRVSDDIPDGDPLRWLVYGLIFLTITGFLYTLTGSVILILGNVEGMGAGNQPNMIVFGIEADQKAELETLVGSYDMPVIQHVPVVTMELAGWQGKTKKEWLSDTTRTARRWAVNREARVSYQAEMSPDDELIEGIYTGVHDGGDSIMISLGERYASGLDVEIGDELVWNVQGAMIKTYVGSIRKINFRKMESRFFCN